MAHARDTPPCFVPHCAVCCAVQDSAAVHEKLPGGARLVRFPPTPPLLEGRASGSGGGGGSASGGSGERGTGWRRPFSVVKYGGGASSCTVSASWRDVFGV